MNEINIAVDVFPYNKDIWSICDYSGEQIYSKLALPLFRYEGSKLSMLAAESYLQTTNEISISIRKDLFWSNGEQVVAEDYARAIHHICQSQHNRYQKLLNSIIIKNNIAIEVSDKYTLIIKTAWYDPFILHYLCLINFSPKHKSSTDIFAGPYQLNEITTDCYRLTDNPFFKIDSDTRYIPTINYLLIPCDPEAKAFHCNDVQASCDTGLDLMRYRASLKDEHFHQSVETLVMLLSPGNRFHQLPLTVRHLIGSSINRQSIANSYDNTLIPLISWMELYDNRYHDCQFQHAKPQAEAVFIEIAFENFYPNKEILERIAEQLAPLNVHITQQEDQYGHWISDCHFRLEIRKAPKNNPIQLIRSDISKIASTSPDYAKIKRLYALLYNESMQSRQSELFAVIDGYLRDQLLYLPLFIFPTGYFCHNKVTTDSLMLPGSRIMLREDQDEN